MQFPAAHKLCNYETVGLGGGLKWLIAPQSFEHETLKRANPPYVSGLDHQVNPALRVKQGILAGFFCVHKLSHI